MIKSVNHELNTPLSQALQMAQYIMMNKSLDSQLQEEFVLPLYKSMVILINVLKDLELYGQFLAGQLSVYFKEFTLSILLKNCIEIF